MAIIVSLPVWLIAALLGLWAIMILTRIGKDDDIPYQIVMRLVLFAIVLLLATAATGWLALYIARNAP